MQDNGVDIITALPAISPSLSMATAIGYEETAVGEAIIIRSVTNAGPLNPASAASALQ